MADPKIRFTGDGTEFHSGIPARTLTQHEYDDLDNDQRATVRDSPLYDYAGYREKVQAAKADPPPAPMAAAAAQDAPAASPQNGG